ncbi:MAG: response regulator transcription factor [Vicinamibacterales bacterium]
MRVLIVEDNPATRDTLTRGLVEELFHVDAVASGAAAEARVQESAFDVIVLDVILPDHDGFTVCRRLRARGVDTPILLLTGRHALDDRVRGLDAGGDDYLAKPFAFRELLARIRALTRRGRAAHAGVTLAHGPIELDQRDHVVRRHGKIVDLTATEFRLLQYLMLRPEAVISRDELARHVWADSIDPHSNVIDVYIGYLRKKLGEDGFGVVRTVRRSGYSLTRNQV